MEKSDRMKKIVLSLFMILVLVGCTKEKNKDQIANIDINNSKEEVEYENINIRLDSFTYKDGYSTINLLITNNNDYEVYIGNYTVKVYDEKDNLIGIFNPTFDSNIKPGYQTNQMFSVEADYRSAYRIDYEFNDIQKIDIKEDN